LNIDKQKKTKKRKSGISQKSRTNIALVLLLTITILFLLLLIVIPEEKEIAEHTEKIESEPQQEVPADREEPEAFHGYMYLVIDDVGYNLEQLDRFLDLPVPITYAILPKLEYTDAAYQKILASGNEVILHQPMEPVGNQNPGPGALYIDMPAEIVRSTISENLMQMPEAVGVNNHMGSLATADKRLMEDMLGEIHGKNPELFFLDSRTTAESVAEDIADHVHIPHSRRNIFLDNISTAEAISTALEEAMEMVEAEGYTIMIGHVWSEELAATLALWYADMEERGYKFALLSRYFSEEVVHAGAGS